MSGAFQSLSTQAIVVFDSSSNWEINAVLEQAAQEAEQRIEARIGDDYTPLIQHFQAANILAEALVVLEAKTKIDGALSDVKRQCVRNETDRLKALIASPDIFKQRREADRLQGKEIRPYPTADF